MDELTFQRLEFPAVLEYVAALAQSPAAREQIRKTRPWTDLGEIRYHWDAVEEILRLLDSGGELSIHNLDDCEEPIARLAMPSGFLEPASWLRLRNFLSSVLRLRRQLQDAKERFPLCWQAAEPLDPLRTLSARIAEIFDPEGQVRDAASSALHNCRTRIRRLEKEIEKVFDRILNKMQGNDVLQDFYWTERGGRRVLPVRAGSRGRLPGIVHDSSNSGETLFIEPFEIVEPSNHVAEERILEQEEIGKILQELGNEARVDLYALQTDREILIQFDLWHARAQLAHRHNLHRPHVAPGEPLQLALTHHPLLYFKAPTQSVPLNIRLDTQNRVLVITGPNTGGKTTALKTIGLTACMVQSAIPVPAAVDSRLPLFGQVLAEMGDDQSVSAGLSTFSAHIRRISWILQNCGKNALVLLDELGKATDPIQAGALGRAILEALTNQGALTLVTTHLSTLKDWAHDSPHGRNASYRLDPRSHRPLYEMQLDTPGISEAFTIALAEGLPQAIVDAALEQLPKAERDLSDMLQKLQESEQRLERERVKAEAARRRANHERDELHKERRQVNRAQLEAEKTLEGEYKALLDQARRDLETRIANLPSRQALAQARTDLQRDQKESQARLDTLLRREERILASSKPVAERQEEGRFVPTVGAWALIGKGEQPGKILKIDESRRQATILLGGLEVRTALKELHRAKAPVEEPQRLSTLRYTTGITLQDVLPEIDLTGQRVEEALENLDKYLDRAILAHLTQVRVVHGFGTGVLRRAVGEFLSTHPLIRSHKLAEPREGGLAVTLAQLK
ncbi:MAG TPA: Smr/MutS family protein [Candidatus Sumerlaeota bacterium]|nr:Smr/MutS family protein [Candidatus Sumerlaeota bacterium]